MPLGAGTLGKSDRYVTKGVDLEQLRKRLRKEMSVSLEQRYCVDLNGKAKPGGALFRGMNELQARVGISLAP
jgi:hypothetical protein